MTNGSADTSALENLSALGLSVVIPVYRSESILPELVRRLESILGKITPDYELVLVNDSSPDRSWDVICRLSSNIRGFGP